MKKILALVGAVGVLVAGNALAKDMQGWKVVGSGTGINENQNYSLYNLDQGSYLSFKDRSGANLGWKSSPNNGMKVKRKGGGSGPIKCGEIFGLFIEKEWLIYERQSAGINLSTRTKLAKDGWYQWKFTNCSPGEVVPLNSPVTLTNTVENDSIVGCKRLWGVNICWANSVVSARGKNYHKDAIPKQLRDEIARQAKERAQ